MTDGLEGLSNMPTRRPPASVSNEENVKQVVAKIQLGEGDAGAVVFVAPGDVIAAVYVGDAGVVAGSAPLELPRLHLDRRREAGGGRLGEEPDPSVRVRVGAARRPRVEDRAGRPRRAVDKGRVRR